MKVPGKKRVVSTAMIFMAELSRLLASATSFESLAMPILMRLNSWDETDLATQPGTPGRHEMARDVPGTYDRLLRLHARSYGAKHGHVSQIALQQRKAVLQTGAVRHALQRAPVAGRRIVLHEVRRRELDQDRRDEEGWANSGN